MNDSVCNGGDGDAELLHNVQLNFPITLGLNLAGKIHRNKSKKKTEAKNNTTQFNINFTMDLNLGCSSKICLETSMSESNLSDSADIKCTTLFMNLF